MSVKAPLLLRVSALALLTLSASACSSSLAVTTDSPRLAHLAEHHDAAVAGLRAEVQIPVPLTEGESGYTHGRETLDSVLRYTLGSNPSVREATLGLVSASVGPAQAIAAYMPTMSLDFGAGATDNSGMTSVGRSHHAGGMFSWTLWDNGAAKLRENREIYKTLAAVASIGERVEVVALSAAQPYVDQFRLRQSVTLAKADIAYHEQLLARVTALRDSGVSSATDVADVSARLSGAKRRLADVQQSMDDSAAIYKRFVGQTPSAGMAQPKSVAVEKTAEAAVKAAQGHPSLRIADAEIKAAVEAGYAIDRERGGSLGIKANLAGLVSAATLAHPAVALGTAFLSFTAPLLDGGSNDLALRRAVSSAEIAIARRVEIGRAIEQAVTQSHNALIAARRHEILAKAQAADLERVAAGRLAEFETARATIVQVLDANAQFMAARIADVNARYASLFAGYRVLAAQGKLNETMGLTNFRSAVVDGIADPFEAASTIKSR